ncbi:MAG: hypothetical protein L0L40_04085, partial [Lactobacillus sp.]|nr:hypothetical protein [Lactobacillus sp.]
MLDFGSFVVILISSVVL